MALLSAQEYFNSFPAATQAEIRASWGGQNLLNEWYANAVAAGSVPEKATTGTQGAPPPGAGGQTFAQWLRAKAKAEGWSEDFERPEFTDAQLEAWQPFFDYKTGKFRSEHEPEGENWGAVFDKPTEVAQGWTLHGNKAVRWSDLPAWAGGPGGSSGAAPVAASGTPSGFPLTSDPLQAALLNMFQSRQGIFGELTGRGATAREKSKDLWGVSLPGGGLWWGAGTEVPTGVTPAPATTPAATLSIPRPAPPINPGEVMIPPGEGPWQELPPGTVPDTSDLLTQQRVDPLTQALMGYFPKGVNRNWWQA